MGAHTWDIPSMQRALNYACWYTEDKFIPITGVMDKETQRSVKEFQRIFGTAQTGNITPAELNMLEAEMIRKNITEY